VSSTEQLATEGGEELQRFSAVGLEGGLRLDPRFGVRKGLEDASPAPDGPLDHRSVDQEQQHDRSLLERRGGPVRRVRQVVLEVQARIPHGFLEQGGTMFIVTVQSVVSEPANPIVGELADK
jgi:hypothetical protein